MAIQKDLVLVQGSTFHKVVRWESPRWRTVPIEGISQSGIVQVQTPTPHGIPDGWRVAVVDAKGMTELNARENPPGDEDLRTASVVSPTAVEFNEISSAAFRAYASGGWLKWREPKDITDYTARMSIKNRVGGDLLLSLGDADGRLVVDAAEFTIELLIDSVTTEGITWAKGVYDLEMVSPSGVVETLMRGAISIHKEITTPI